VGWLNTYLGAKGGSACREREALFTVIDRMRVVIGRRFTKQSQARETRRAGNCVTIEGRLIDSRFLPSGYTLLVAVKVDVILDRVSTGN
jgi:hypothetical protein